MLKDSVNCGISNGTPSDAAFLDTMTSTQPDKLKVHEIPSTWLNLSKVDANVETRPTDTRILAALSLRSHSEMWTWFDEQVTMPTKDLAANPISSLKATQLPKMPNEWIFPLFQAVYMALLVGNSVDLKAESFFPDLIGAQDYNIPSGGSPTSSRILRHVEGAVASWLQFRSRPGMALDTSRAVATFTSIALKAFKSPSFLYLHYIQHGIKKLRSILTNEGIPLAQVPWERLAEELRSHPLASPNSDTTLAANCLEELLWSISSLPRPHSTDMSVHYKKAVEMGGVAGEEAFAQFMAQQHPT